MSVIQTLIQTSIYAGVLFAALLLAKKLLQGRLSPSLQYFLWFLLLARLVIPVTVQSGFHLFTIPYAEEEAATETVYKSSEAIPPQTIFDGQGTFNTEIVRTVPSAEELAAAIGETANGAATDPQTPIAQEPAPSFPVPDTGAILLLAWIGGMAIVGGATMRNYMRLQKEIRRTTLLPPRAVADMLCEVKRELHIKRRVSVRISGSLATPALTASLFPKILIPVDLLLEPEKLRFALLHELIHFKRLDYAACLLMLALRAVYWFNPVVWLMQPLIKTDMEASCDSLAADALDEGGKQHYAATILDMLSGRQKPQLVLGMSLKSNRKTAEKRLRSVFARAKTGNGAKAVSILLTIVLGVACFTTACVPQQAEAPEVEDASGGPPVYTDNSDMSFGATEDDADKIDAYLQEQEDTLAGRLRATAETYIADGAFDGNWTFNDSVNPVEINIAEGALFDSGNATLRGDDATQLLGLLGDALGENADSIGSITVEGHTDNVPIQTADFHDNLDLSSARVNSVAGYLSEAGGLPIELFTVLGRGEWDPIASNETAEGREANRRITILVTDKNMEAANSELQTAYLVRFEDDGTAAVLEQQDGTELGIFHHISYEQLNYASSEQGRTQNIQKASELLNDILIEPGQTLSFNEIIGDRTVENGWQEVPAIEEGIYTPTPGGGVCLVATALYNAALKAELEIVQRVPHTVKPAYETPGLDATVSTGGPDLVIKNNTDSTILIMMDNTDFLLSCDIWSTEKKDYIIGLDTQLVSSAQVMEPALEYAQNESMAPYAVMQMRPGQAYEQYQILMSKYDRHGNLIEADIPVGTSTYSAIAAKYEVGPGMPLPKAGTPIEEVQEAASALAEENT